MDDNWHENAIIYAIDVGRFADSNGDGVGDFPGLTGRLGYLADLGITCVWLLPCYPTPDRDNGYDIRDYYGIDPRHGTLDDFVEFLHKAGEYGIQVILDLVVNHTSDRHPWFQAARRDEASRLRDYYVWASRPPPIPPGLESLFPGEERSVWTYDEVARSYYFHRFYHFQPDLNVANPEVRREITQIMDFWLSFGISGFRLDAAAPMVQQKGIPGAGPDDPHGILRELYAFLIERRAGAALLGEVDVEPEQLRSFFEHGGQMNLVFNFVLNNYLFLALARQEAEPILRGIRKLPRMPESGQWVNFLRNLDDLDLERLSADERAEVMDVFAPDPGMRVFGRGIRRRLAPMLGGDRRRLELAFSLLFSAPGTPMFIYGEEIGMGENLDLHGRNAVRAPMQWSAGRNAGFSDAKPDRLTQPPIDKGPFSYRTTNVAGQQEDPASLLNTVKTFIRLRRQFPDMARAAWNPVDVKDPGVLAHSYNLGGQLLVMVHNLTDRERTVELAINADGARRLKRLLAGGDEWFNEDRLRLAPYDYRWYLHEGV